MKKNIVLCSIILFIAMSSSGTISAQTMTLNQTHIDIPGEILTISCTDSYPTLGEPVHLIITFEGSATQRFNETIIVRDEFSGFALTAGEMTWISGNTIENHANITIGKLPKYTLRIPWYPTVVGNHTLHVSAAASTEKTLNLSVGFDVEGIISPSLGCPSLICKSDTQQLSITLSEERLQTDEPTQITQVTLQTINGSDSYDIDNSTGELRTWIKAGPEIIEDELIASYNISSIPIGFYNLTVRTPSANYSWPHAVQLLNTLPTNYTVVQLTDIHIGKSSNLINEKKELIQLLSSINDVINPQFVILSGDSVDWYNERAKHNAYADLQDALLHCHVPIFTVPGNHERYTHRLLFLYFPYTNLTPYHRFLNPISDYSIHYGNMNFVFLDSGYDYSRWELPKIWTLTPEGSGLTNTQMYLLNNTWGNTLMNQIIIMHHPAVNDKNDTGLGALPNDLPSGNDECIAFNRGAFITYCLEHNVSLVLTGHSHENHVFNSLGKEPDNPTTWPLFIQTDSATLSKQDNGGRIIQIQNNTITRYDYAPFH
jgi:predicted MPP superfamily phosphohydrolase